MDRPSTFRELIALWPSRSEFAEDLGVSAARVHKWAVDRPIRAEFFARILAAAQERGFDVTADDLVRISADRAVRSPEEFG